jgi:hypothetical protein
MTPATGYALSTMLTQLTGRDVGFALKLKPAPYKGQLIYGVYTTVPHHGTVVVKAELALLGSFAGALVMLPNDVITGRIKTLPLEELLRDAIHEVLNVTSTCFASGGRVVFQTMHFDENLLGEAAQAVFRKPGTVTHFDVTVKGYTGGQFAVLTSN